MQGSLLNSEIYHLFVLLGKSAEIFILQTLLLSQVLVFSPFSELQFENVTAEESRHSLKKHLGFWELRNTCNIFAIKNYLAQLQFWAERYNKHKLAI